MPPSATVTPASDARAWLKVLNKYKEPSVRRSIFEIFVTAGPYFLLWIAAVWTASISYWITVPLAMVAGGFLVRLFLIQHDCGHGSFFKNRHVNDWVGRAIGVLTITPYDVWKNAHLIHHSSHGNLDMRGVGDIHTLTVSEYKERSVWGRFMYRMYRNPITLFVFGPIYVFFIYNRLPFGFFRAGWRYWVSAIGTNIGVIIAAAILVYFIGLIPFLVVYFLSTSIAAAIGVWLFYVQHQFEDTMWDTESEWQLHEAALYGSSHYDLPLVLRWMTANIGIHHIHHLYSRIPFYRLSVVLKDHPHFKDVRRLTLLESFKCVRMQLWDEEARKLVSFKEVRA